MAMFSLFVVIVFLFAFCTLFVRSDDVSVCGRYASAFFDGNSAYNQTALVTTIVTAAIFGMRNDSGVVVPGMIQADSPVRPYLTGEYQYRANGLSPNFTNDTAAMEALADHLVAYIGAVINCSATTFPPIATANMYDVHRNMNIDQPLFDYWNAQFMLAAAAIGVNATDVALLERALTQYGRCGGIVFGGQSQICSDRGCDIATSAVETSCASYAVTFCNAFAAQMFAGGDSVQNERSLMTTIVTRAALGNGVGVVGWLSSPIVGGWFNGSIRYAGSGTVNYTNTSNGQVQTLVAHMVSYIGTVLAGCDAPGFASEMYSFAVGTQDMFNAHANMNITQTAFDAFRDQINDALQSFALDMSDDRIALFLSAFTSFGLCGPLIGDYKTQICGEVDCEVAVNADCGVYNGSEPYEPPMTNSLCQRYGGDNQLEYITAIVAKTFTNLTLTNSPLLRYFDGTLLYRKNTENYLRNNASLLEHFSYFFAFLLECSDVESVAGTIADEFANGFDMFAVHRNMQITQSDYDYFTSAFAVAVTAVSAINETEQIGLTQKMQSFGKCAGVVNGGRWQICNDRACDLAFASDEPTCEETYLPSICSRYASSSFEGGDSVQNQFALVTAVLTAAFNKSADGGYLSSASPLLPYFTGAVEYNGINQTVNFTADAALLADLIARKATFIGQLLGCAADGWATDTFHFPNVNSSVWRVHEAMNIDQTLFTAFNQRIVDVVTEFGMAKDDVTAVADILSQFGRCATLEDGSPAQVCSADDCEEAPTADCSLYPQQDDDDSYTLLIIVIVVVLVAICAIIAVVYLRRANMATAQDSERANLITQDSAAHEQRQYSSTRM